MHLCMHVNMVLKYLLKIEIPIHLDATDGLAVAVCHSMQNINTQSNGAKSWKDFINKNPGRLV